MTIEEYFSTGPPFERPVFDAVMAGLHDVGAARARGGHLLDREHLQGDLRSATVKRLASRFDVDPGQARRVSQVACQLFGQLRGDDDDAEEHERLKRKVELDFDTARRLFTLVTVLHWKG